MTFSLCRSRPVAMLGAVVAMIVLASGCATSYVNIPADGKDTALNAINVPPVPTVLETAIAYAVQTYPVQGPYAIQVPDGLWPRTQREIVAALEETGVTPYDGSRAGDHVYSVVRIYIRGNIAETTMVLPARAGDERRILTIRHRGGPFGWPVEIGQLTYAGPEWSWPSAMMMLPASAQAGYVDHGWDPRHADTYTEPRPIDRPLAPVRPATDDSSIDDAPDQSA